MSNPTTFSYSFSSPASNQARPVQDIFAVDRLSHFELGSGQMLARNPRTGHEMALPADHFHVLVTFCSAFRTLDEHVDELMKGSDGDPARAVAIQSVVESVRDGGLTIYAKEICDELTPSASASPIDEKPIAVVITCDRPEALDRLLGSIIDNCDPVVLDRVFVVDDSRSEENGDRNREIAGTAAARGAIDVSYFGAEEARGLLDDLIRKLPEHEEEVRFLIDRERWKDEKSYGVARNFSHLLTVGSPVIVFDDDALCEAFDSPFQKPGVEFTAGQREAAFYRSHEEWRSAANSDGADPITRHMQCLGLSLVEALRQLGLSELDQEALRPAPLPLARSLNQASRVLITECGSLGDPGTGGNQWLASLPDSSRERLLSDEGLLEEALRQRCCWLGRERPAFRANASISQVTGFDNRGYLPPYFPITRGEDRLFGQLSRFIFPDSLILDYPWAVPHLPINERGWTERDNSFRIAGGFPGSLLNTVLLGGEGCLATDPESRLAFLARRLEDLSEAPEEVLVSRLVDDRHDYRASKIRGIRDKLNRSAESQEAWRRYLESALAQAESSQLASIRIDNLRGSVGDLQGRELVDFWRGAWRSFGRSLLCWGEVREAAREYVQARFGG
jgi:hypothetical protein